jgi:hypothetical protein
MLVPPYFYDPLPIKPKEKVSKHNPKHKRKHLQPKKKRKKRN